MVNDRTHDSSELAQMRAVGSAVGRVQNSRVAAAGRLIIVVDYGSSIQWLSLTMVRIDMMTLQVGPQRRSQTSETLNLSGITTNGMLKDEPSDRLEVGRRRQRTLIRPIGSVLRQEVLNVNRLLDDTMLALQWHMLQVADNFLELGVIVMIVSGVQEHAQHHEAVRMSGRLRHGVILFHVVVHEMHLGRVVIVVHGVLAALLIVGAPMTVELIEPIAMVLIEMGPIEGRCHTDLVWYFDLPREAGIVELQIFHPGRILDDERFVLELISGIHGHDCDGRLTHVGRNQFGLFLFEVTICVSIGWVFFVVVIVVEIDSGSGRVSVCVCLLV